MISNKPTTTNTQDRISTNFGQDVFTLETMRQYLPEEVFLKLGHCIKTRSNINREYADIIAEAMCRWATNKGATHYSHWFHPLTGQTAEKHDSFLEFDKDKKAISKLSGKLLIQQEPDASSFPSGGIRNTFEARGYTAWDISSPAFILENTLCIPTIFISYTGEALDYKTPLLKSQLALNKVATKVCSYFDKSVSSVTSYLGWEQEFFLVDESMYQKRPDLLMTGRTLMGHESAKSQQLEDHYLGTIPTRVAEFFKDLEKQCHALAIPVKTQHNEVAPNQFEIAPLYEEANLSIDHNLLLMSVMKKVAEKHSLRVLLHEKPFKGLNGSGKHCNWSLGTDTGVNLFSPGKTKQDNFQFIVFLVNLLNAVYKFNSLLKASITSDSNFFRLGGNEAPPSIISIFLGTKLSSILDDIEQEDLDHILQKISLSHQKETQSLLDHVPDILIDNTDRNRTSPFAFTGNRFEFRAVGSSANCASSMIILHSILADQLIDFDTKIQENLSSGKDIHEAIFIALKQYIKESKPIRFDGNGYSEEWLIEAKKRGLNCDTNPATIFDSYLEDKAVSMFNRTEVFTQKELLARNEVKWEYYIKKIQIESNVLSDLATNHIIPVAIRYQNLLLDNVCKLKNIYSEDEVKFQNLSLYSKRCIEDISKHIGNIKDLLIHMKTNRKQAATYESTRQKALGYATTVVPDLDKIRTHIDELEMMVDNNIWPLPKYRELLML